MKKSYQKENFFNRYRGIEIGIADNLGRKESLARSGAEEAAHHSVGKIHLVSYFTHSQTDLADVGLNFSR